MCLGCHLCLSGSQLHLPEKEDAGPDDGTTSDSNGPCGVLPRARRPAVVFNRPVTVLLLAPWTEKETEPQEM